MLQIGLTLAATLNLALRNTCKHHRDYQLALTFKCSVVCHDLGKTKVVDLEI